MAVTGGIPKSCAPAQAAGARAGSSAFALEQALAPEGSEDDPLYLAAMAVEADERLSAKITEWDGTIAERLEGETFTAQRG